MLKILLKSSPARAPKLQLAVEQPSTGGCWNPPKNDIPCPKTKEKLQHDGRRGTIRIKSNPVPAKWADHKLDTNTEEILPLFSHRTEGFGLISTDRV